MQIPGILYGTAWKKEHSTRLVKDALAAGFTGFDTANQHKHYREDLVGEALKGQPRDQLFLQTKFTPIDGQDSVVPYDPKAPEATQVEQSFASSLKHLHTTYLDSYLLHGPYGHPGLIDEDWEVWGALESLYKGGGAKQIGISNVNALQLKTLIEQAHVKPHVVQNRCFANRGWDAGVRTLCRQHGILYQGFSLLTANPQVLYLPEVLDMAQRLQVEPPQIIFRFAAHVGMVPLTGTTDPLHMKQDLESINKIALAPHEIEFLERAAL